VLISYQTSVLAAPVRNAKLLSMRQAAEHLAIDYDTFRAYVNRGLIAPVRYPSLYKDGPRRTKLFRVEELDRFILENQEETGTETGTKSPVPSTRNYRKQWYEKVKVL
jgi:hypothetical protein